MKTINWDDSPENQVKQVINGLVASNEVRPTLFARGNNFVRISTDSDGRVAIEKLSEMALRARTYDCVSFINSRNRKIRPPIDVIRDVMYGDEWIDRFPHLIGLVQTPVMHCDGSIKLDEGYDPLTKLYYYPGKDLVISDIPRVPNREDIKRALDIIWEPFRDFRFKGISDGTHVLAAMFSIVFRNFIEGSVPLLLIDKPQAGTGASLISQVIGIISENVEPAICTMPCSEEEWKKQILSILINGKSMIILDNIEGKLKSPTLAALLTSDEFRERKLGTNDSLTLPHKIVWIGNGNNVELSGDLPRRVYWSRMDSETVRPWMDDRKFKHDDLKRWTRDHRGDILGAMFTIVKGWVMNGRMKPSRKVPNMGGFEQWRDFIGGILEYAEVEGFLGNVNAMYEEADSETPEWTCFVDAWYREFGDEPQLVRDIFRAITPRRDYGNIYCQKEDLRNALPDIFLDVIEKEGSFTRMLGKALAKRKDRRYPGGYKIEHCGTSQRAVKWRVIKIDKQTKLEGAYDTLINVFV